MHRFKNLEIWQHSRVFCSEIYALTSDFHDSERFGLTNQLRRASVSIPSIIAEVSSRNSQKEFARFIEIAIRSAYEIETQLLTSYDLKYISDKKLILCQRLDDIIRMMSHLKKSLI